MDYASLLDGPSAAIVVGGTLLATLLRCGLGDARAVLAALSGLVLRRRRFDADGARAELAAHVSEMRIDGVLRAEPSDLGDEEIDEATGALIGSRSLSGLHEAHLAHRRRRAEASTRAVRTLMQAADLAPVFGLAGTLVSLSQLPSTMGPDGAGDFTSAISMAVVTTLYGLLFGHLCLTPLGRLVARAAAQEEQARAGVIAWLEQQLEPALPRLTDPRGPVRRK